MESVMERAGRMLEEAGVRATANRVLVLGVLLEATSPRSLIELETELDTVDRSSILRVLTVLHEHDVIHTVEDGRGVTKYEICHGHDHCSVDDMHPHFYCERCERVTCLSDEAIPRISVPEGYEVRTVNYMLKGICKECGKGLR